ncbi:MAG: ABC transporter substrate-binding protein [Sphingomonadales bacterium]
MRRFLTLFYLPWALLWGCAEPPPEGETLTIGVGLEPPNLDPTIGAAAAVDEVVYANLFEGLTRIDRNGNVQPALAMSWDVLDAGRLYRFRLVPNAVFHNGVPFTADIAKQSLDRITAPGSANAQQQLFKGITSVRASSIHTLDIMLTAPDPEFLFKLGWGDAVMVEPSTLASNASQPVGTGPYRFARWITGTSITLERFEDYWGERPAAQQVTFKFISDAAGAYGAIMAGDVDGISNFGAPELLSVIEATGRFTVTNGMTEGETVLGLNMKRAPFDDIRVRKAIAMAIDRGALIDGALYGYGVPIGSFFSPLHPAYVDLSRAAPCDPAMAKQLLAQANVSLDWRPVLKLPPTGYARRGGEIIAAQLRQVGLDVTLEAIDWPQWLSTVLGQGDYDMTIVSHTEPMDIGFFARPDNYFGYDSAAFRNQLESGDLAAAQRQLAVDQAAVFLFQLPQVGVWRKEITGQWQNAPIQANDVTAIQWIGSS